MALKLSSRGGTTSQVGQVSPDHFTGLYYKIYRCDYRKYYCKYYAQINPMYAWAMLTKFNYHSATCVKNIIVFYYIYALFHTLLMLDMSA